MIPAIDSIHMCEYLQCEILLILIVLHMERFPIKFVRVENSTMHFLRFTTFSTPLHSASSYYSRIIITVYIVCLNFGSRKVDLLQLDENCSLLNLNMCDKLHFSLSDTLSRLWTIVSRKTTNDVCCLIYCNLQFMRLHGEIFYVKILTAIIQI